MGSITKNCAFPVQDLYPDPSKAYKKYLWKREQSIDDRCLV